MERAMAVPTAVVMHRGAKGSGHTLQQRLQDCQGQSCPGSAIGGFAEMAVAEVSEPRDGKVAVKNLDDKEMNRGDGIQDAPAEVVAGLATNGSDLPGVKNVGDVALDPSQGGVNVLKHP